MKLLDYLNTIGWLPAEVIQPEGPAKSLARLLDLEISVQVAELVDVEAPMDPIEADDLAPLIQSALHLSQVIRDAEANFSLTISHWDLGRYRVLHGQRIANLLLQAGFGTIEKSDERWQRTGRLVWSSAQEFVETHFKRARMKVRLAHKAFAEDGRQGSPSIRHLIKLDDVLLQAKLRRVETLSASLMQTAHGRFLTLWRDARPILETDEALSVIVDGTSKVGWMGHFLDELGQVYQLILSLETQACTVMPRALRIASFGGENE